jgi:hypothetical protein
VLVTSEGVGNFKALSGAHPSCVRFLFRDPLSLYLPTVASLAYLLGFNKLMRPDRFPANDDADKINVPLLLLPSQNEDMNVVSSPRTLPLTPLIPLTLAYFCHSNLASSCASLSIVRRIALLMTALLR